jgi:hypothetical protein
MKNSERVRAGIEVLKQYGWTKGTFAVDVDDNKCSPYSEKATCFCATGAIVRGTENNWEAVVRALEVSDLYEKFYHGERTLVGINDEVAQTKEELIEYMEIFAQRLEDYGQ